MSNHRQALERKKKPTAIILLSGGLDSATVLAIASQHYQCYCISFDYGQRSLSEIKAAKKLAQQYHSDFQLIKIDTAVMTGSALTDIGIDVPKTETDGIPVTYVPARNTLFLSYALAIAEVHQSFDVFIGVNAIDFSGYPDCRPAYIKAFQAMANLATKATVENKKLKIHTPLIDLTKAQIIQKGLALNVDYHLSVSCYQADEQGRACGSCDSCRLRKMGFIEAGVEDLTHYFA